MIGGPPILPDDGAIKRTAGGAFPQQRRLALIGDTDGGDVARAGAGLSYRIAAGCDGRRPKVFRLVLNLSVGWKVLREFLLGNSGD